MADEYEFVPYKDISELKRELEGVKDKKDISGRDIHGAVTKLTDTMNDMLGIFAGAAEQLKLEESEYESENRKHDAIIAKLEKLIDQNKTIAEGMLAIVDLVKEKFPENEKGGEIFTKDEEPSFAPEPKAEEEPKQFVRQEWKQSPQAPRPMLQMQTAMPQMPSLTFGAPLDEFASQLPPMEPAPMPDLDLPEEPFPMEEPKKKGLFGVFKK